MTPENFCYWLQGYFELTKIQTGLSVEQTQMIQNHLNLVFYHSIDPMTYGEDNGVSQNIHDGLLCTRVEEGAVEEALEDFYRQNPHLDPRIERIPGEPIAKC